MILTVGWEINEEDVEGPTAWDNSGACTSGVQDDGGAGVGKETVITGGNQETTEGWFGPGDIDVRLA